MPHATKRTPSRLPVLDGLRGIAIGLVLLVHFAGSAGWPLGFLAGLGWSGVDLFFVLSGYLITGILLRAKGTEGYYRSFYARRALRILPLYYGLLVCLLVLARAMPTWPGGSYFSTHQMWFWTHTSNWLIAADPRASGTDLAGLWSLSVEEQFYLVWPWLVATLSSRTLIRGCVAVLILSPLLRCGMAATGAPVEWLYAFTITRLDPLAIGALIAIAAAGDRLGGARRAAVAVTGGAALAIELLVWAGRTTSQDIHTFPLLASALAFFWGGVLVLTLQSSGTWKRILTAPSLRFLGFHSYAVYLLQSPMHAVLKAVGAGPEAVGLLRYAAIALPMCLVLSYLIWHGWEKHWLRLKARFPMREAELMPAP